jgi:hypothetical protein
MEITETMFFKIMSHEGVFPMGILYRPDGEPIETRGGIPCLYNIHQAKSIARQMGYVLEMARGVR